MVIYLARSPFLTVDYILRKPHVAFHFTKIQGSRESSRGPGEIYVVTALIEYLTVLLEYIDLLGPVSRVGPRAKCPSCPPLWVALLESLFQPHF